MYRLSLRSALCAAVAGLAIVATAPARAATLQTVYSFAGGDDGSSPYGQLAMDRNGLLYGVTVSGGAGSGGTLFKLDPATGVLTTLYAFTTYGATGSNPAAGVVIDSKGVLYGTTESGGSSSCNGGCGTVYKFDPSTNLLTTLVSFTGGTDGRLPAGSLILYGGMLYGTTVAGGYVPAGGSSGRGVIFKLNPKTKALTTLHEFNMPGANDGVGPEAALVVGPDGRLYGTASAGGPHGSGTVFAINPTSGAFSLLHGFDYHVDGNAPTCKLFFRQGQIIGTTSSGGPTSAGDGTVFSLDPNSGIVTTLYSMAGTPDGIFPQVGVVHGPHGLLYGANEQGGGSGAGTLYTVSPTTHAFTLLHDFAISDGSQPSGELLYDGNASLYGVTSAGGRGHGLVYKITP